MIESDRQTQEQHVARRTMLKALGGGGVAALGLAHALGIDVAAAQSVGDNAQTILDVAITAEALGTTLFYGVVTESTFFRQLPAIQQEVIRAVLTTEQAHFDVLYAQGGRPRTTAFFRPDILLQSLPLHVAVVDYLESTCIGAYLAATRRLAELNMPVMAAVAFQLGGTEAEHRVLNRVLGREVAGNPLLPNNIPWERPTLGQVSQAAQVLAPFLEGGSAFDRQFVGPLELPPREAVLAAGLPLDQVPTALEAYSSPL